MLYSQESGSIRSPINAEAFPLVMNSTKVQNPRHKMKVALLAEPKTPLESSVFI